VERAVNVIFKLMQSQQFKEHFVNWKQSWYFPKKDEIEILLEKSRFKDIQVHLSKRTTYFSDRDEFAIFVKAVIMKPFLGYLPNDKKREEFLEEFLKEMGPSSSKWSLDYVRLGISARR
jgi:hypothetical protein